MLRHACGYKLAKDGVETAPYKGTCYRDIHNTTRNWRSRPIGLKGFGETKS
jgi:hypothetical protein